MPILVLIKEKEEKLSCVCLFLLLSYCIWGVVYGFHST